MSEAVLILQRAVSAYGSQIRLYTRKLEKAEPQSDEARAAQHNIDQCRVRVADLQAALQQLGAPYEPMPDGRDWDVSDVRGGERPEMPPAAVGEGVAAKEPGL